MISLILLKSFLSFTRHLGVEAEGCAQKVGTLVSASVYNKRGSYGQEDVFMVRAAVHLRAQQPKTKICYNYIWNLHSLSMQQIAKQIILQASQLAGRILPTGPFWKWMWCSGKQNMIPTSPLWIWLLHM